jgi:IS30 family transposase
VTNDNGGEFAKHKELENILGVAVYFARPYAPWQRGSNEYSIGLVRQFIPKGSDISEISDQRIQEIEYAINTRPRKMFAYKSSHEMLYNESLALCPQTRHWRYDIAHLKVG